MVRVDSLHIDQPDYIYLIGSDILSQDLHDVSEKANNQDYVGLTIDYRFTTTPLHWYMNLVDGEKTDITTDQITTILLKTTSLLFFILMARMKIIMHQLIL